VDLGTVRDIGERLRREVHKVVVGQDRALNLLLVALLSEGHVLLEGMPGVAKTLLARAFASALSLAFNRIQFTPDLMPGDVTGTNLFNFASSQFTLNRGPIFTEVLLADEINRTPPKTQSALLQAMQERTVTIDGKTHDLGPGFTVVATQNPIEQEGTYPLPEAQLDRFLFKVPIAYPSRDEERELVRVHGHRSSMPRLADFGIERVASLKEILEARRAVAEIRLAPELVDYVVDIVRATRENAAVACGASPRAANMLATAARALAALSGRDYATPDDVKKLAPPALGHRLVLAPGTEIDGLSADTVLKQVLKDVAAPR
jgi:MoxR-like ATPase